jgi:hypothetical protein
LNFEDLHNELDSFPEELNYSEERWAEALAVIEAHEASVLRKKFLAGITSAVAAFVVFAVFMPFNFQENSSYSPRANAIQLLAWESENLQNSSVNSEAVSERLEEVSIASQKMEFSTDENVKALSPKSNTISVSDTNFKKEALVENSGSAQEERTQLDEVVLSEEPLQKEFVKLTSSTQSVETKEEPKGILLKDESLGKLTLDLASSNLNFQLPEQRIQGIGVRTSLLQSRKKRNNKLRSKELRTSRSIFTVYKEFVGFKVGVNPWSDYGTSMATSSYNPSVGLFYESIIRPNISWSAGAEYFNINSFDLAVSSSQTSYNYGAESNITQVHTNKAHFISLPLSIGVRPFSRVQVKGGVAPGVLLETENTLEEHFVSHDTKELLSSNETRGYRNSFKTLQVTATIGANYWFSKRNNIQFTLHKGFTDFSKNEVFGNSNDDSTSRFEISLNRVIR